jgi:hypothetical protein
VSPVGKPADFLQQRNLISDSLGAEFAELGGPFVLSLDLRDLAPQPLRLHLLLVRILPLLEFDLSQLVVDNGSPIEQLLLFEKPSATEKTSSMPTSGGTKARRRSTPIC